MRHRCTVALAWMIGFWLASMAAAEPRLGRFIAVIDGLPDVERVAFADRRTAYALHAGEPPIVRLAFDDPDAPPRIERLTIAAAREAGAPDELWHPAVSADHPFWIEPPPAGLITPIAIARDDAGNTLLLDKHGNALHSYNESAGTWTSVGDWGAFPGLFAHPSGAAAAAGRVYVADTRNHRIQVLDDRLSYLGEWGLHVVRPHEDEGHLHYPVGIAVSSDGALAIVAEPMQNRLQIFGLVREGDESAIAEPMFERETIAHFGPHAARDGQLLVTTEPDRPGLIVWDLSRPLPIMIGQIVGHGDEFGRFRGVGEVALRVDGPNGVPRVWALDPVLQRLQIFDLDWSPEKVLGFDPFMARFVRAVDLAAALGRDDARITGFLVRDDGTLLLHDAGTGSLVATDARLRVLRTFEQLHAPSERVRLCHGPDDNTAALLHTRSGRLDLIGLNGDGTETRRQLDLRGADSASSQLPSIDYADLLFVKGDDGIALWIADRRTHRVIRHAFDAGDGLAERPDLVLGLVNERMPEHPRQRIAGGLFHKPSGLLLDNLGHIIVIDEGNHRIQFLDRAGRFLDTHGALWYIQGARRTAPGRSNP